MVEKARARGLISSEHFTVRGTLIEEWASYKGFRPKPSGRQTDPLQGRRNTIKHILRRHGL